MSEKLYGKRDFFKGLTLEELKTEVKEADQAEMSLDDVHNDTAVTNAIITDLVAELEAKPPA